jgi:hypothetical protein
MAIADGYCPLCLRDRIEDEREACADVAKGFITAGSGSPYVNGMNDSAVRIYQCILARGK